MAPSEFSPANPPDPREWVRLVAATALCLVCLGMAMGIEAASPYRAIPVYCLSFAAGLWFLLPLTIRSVASGNVDVDFLMIEVALGAWALGHPAEGAFLLVLFCGSRAMEAYARERTRRAIQLLFQEMPTTANRKTAGGEEPVAIDDLRQGDLLVIRPGNRFPVDCRIATGTSCADCSAITGESEPLAVSEGTEVPSGAINGNGLVEALVLRPAAESSYQKIIHLIETAPDRKSPAQEFADRTGRIFTRVILTATGAGFLAWWLLAGLDAQTAMYRAMALLVAGSPCALVLSIPSAVLAAIAAGARRGVLFHGGRGLLETAHIQTIAFDKTGTLSTGEPRVESVEEAGAKPRDYAIALELARSTTHPAANAVRAHLEPRANGASLSISGVEEVPGRGAAGEFEGQHVFLGRVRAPLAHDAGPCVGLEVNGEQRLVFHLSETIREDAASALCCLRRLGLREMLLSGDRQNAVNRIARSLGIESALGELRPEDKTRCLVEESRRSRVMMVGDGVNDAPALAAAHVGAAMGTRGSAATLAQADLILLKDRLTSLVSAVQLGRRARQIVRQNIAIAVGAAALLMFFAVLGRLPLSLGVFGHEGGTVLVVLNSLRLLGFREDCRCPCPERLERPCPLGEAVEVRVA
ncbi:cadmium-translocating P-type ATPase [Candidatus Poribacteria bacterium]|nr:cadmium-translocating P-type ATPase [Candidatus Poribacteria bacterium]